jgi:hypothetical protein
VGVESSRRGAAVQPPGRGARARPAKGRRAHLLAHPSNHTSA